MTKLIKPLTVGQRVAMHGHTTYGYIAKRAGKNRYWVTLPDHKQINVGPVTVYTNRNQFSIA